MENDGELTLSDLEASLNIQCLCFDENRKKEIVNTLNSIKVIIFEKWPMKDPLCIFLAYIESKCDIVLFLKNIIDISFRYQIIQIAISHKSSMKCDKFVFQSPPGICTDNKITSRYGTSLRKGIVVNQDVLGSSNMGSIRLITTSISFLHKKKVYRVGSRVPSNMKDYVLSNPITGCVDPITCEPMLMPTLSPDGYVLDYSTWIKLIAEIKINPYTQQPLTTKRQLTILTFDNLPYLKPQIKNWDAINEKNSYHT